MISDRSLRPLLRSDRAVLLWGDVFRVAIAAGVLILILLWLLFDAAIVHVMTTTLHFNDFGKFYYSARYFLDGTDMYASSPSTTLPFVDGGTHQYLNMNPPHFHLFILPFARLDPGTALAVWSVLGLAGLIWSVWLTTRELRLHWTIARALWAILAFLACSATSAIIATGQLTFQILPLVTFAWIAARRGAWMRAGLLLGILAAIKPNLGLFGVCLLVAGQWRAVAAMAATTAASFGVGLAIFGWDAHVKWIGALRSIDWVWAPMNGSLRALFTRTFEGGALLPPMVDAPNLAVPATVLASAAVVGVSLWQIGRNRNRLSADHLFAIALLAAQLVSPLGWVYYLWLAAGPLIAIWLSARARPSRLREAAVWFAVPGLLWQLPLFSVGIRHWWQPATLQSIYMWTTLWLWIAVVVDLKRLTSPPWSAPGNPSDSK